MKKIAALLLLTFNFALSQNNYKPAYYITNLGNRVDGYVLNSDLQETDKISFKTDLDKDNVIVNIKDFTEIVVGNEKYISRNVEYAINRLTDSSDFIKENNDPIFKTQQLLLSVLIEGNASLYVASINEVTLYFIKMADSEKIINLVYYKYKEIDDKENNGYGNYENNLFRRQLLQYANCPSDGSLTRFNSVSYLENDLKKVVNDYNVCKNGVSSDLTKNIVKQKLKIAIIAGAKFQDVHVDSNDFYASPKSDINFSPSLGLELSYRIPSKSESTEVFFRITFDKVDYLSENVTPNPSGTSIIYETVSFKSNFLHFEAGPRYYFSGGKKSSMFVQAAFAYTMLFSDKFGYSVSTSENNQSLIYFDTQSYLGANFGLGYQFDKKYSIELGYNVGSEFSPSSYFKNGMSSFGLNLKYVF